jgi:hypothetical protein
VFAKMPRGKTKRPTEFLSDGEEEADPQVTSDSTSSHNAAVVLAKPLEVVRPSTPVEEACKKPIAKDKEAKYPPSTDTVNKQVEGARVHLAELVAILANSNASMKGRIDDTGRFELSFEFNQDRQITPPAYESPPRSVSSDSPGTHRKRRSSGSINGWKRFH